MLIPKKTKIECGLTQKEVETNRKLYGKNEISAVEKDSFFKKLLETLGDPIIKILLIALAIKVVFLFQDFDWFETLGIVIAIFIASFISTLSEYGSEQAFEKLQEESSRTNCKVKRGHKVLEIPIDEVVVNDLILLQSGDKIPADGMIVQGEISVDESSLNGETKEAYKEPTRTSTLTDKNLVYRGTTVYSKEAWMQVMKVGNDTFYGQMAKELQETQPESPLKIRLRGLAKVISRIGYCSAFFVSFSYLFSVIVLENQFDWNLIWNTITNFPVISSHILYALTLSVTIIVVAVPEGLPMMITLVLSSNMKRMLKNHVLVRKLVGIETAGSLNLLFTDKTGTLTKGKLEVIGLVSGSLKEYRSLQDLKVYPDYEKIVRMSMAINNASSYSEDNQSIVGGNITDRALLSFIGNELPCDYKTISSVAFDSKNKYASTLIESSFGKWNLIKGSFELLLPKCRYYYNELGKKISFSPTSFQSLLTEKAKQGIRILALAINNNYQCDHLENLTLVALVFIKDEVRPEAIEGIRLVQEAGIETVMITGDNKDTARAIGEEVGLIQSEQDLVLTSSELSHMSDEEVAALLPRLRIVARSLPQDKSRLVKIGQSLGLVVGMTGDGVNDAPALKKADVGFAMGSGTEVAKEASEIVILDDNFLSISKAILFGRTIFKSIRKFIIFQLTMNLCAVSLSIFGPFIGVETPVTVIQMLWINMIMDTLAGIAFAYESPLKEYMKEPPKKKEEPIMNSYMYGEIIFTGLYSSLLCILFLKLPMINQLFRSDPDNKFLMTAFFGLFIFMGIFNCFNARTHRLNLFAHLYRNKIFMIVITFILLVQIYLIYYGGTLFRTFGLTFHEFEIMILLAATVIPIDWLRKIFLRLRGQKGGV